MITPKPTVPLMSAEQATKLLSELVYERLLHCIDSASLVELEQEIAFAMHECGFDMTECIEGALGMLQAALVRFANNPKGWLPPQPPVSDGDRDDDDDECPLCQKLEAEVVQSKARQPRQPSRKPAS